MVQVIFAKNYRTKDDIGWDADNEYSKQSPIIHIHSEIRHIHGNEVSVTIKGDMRIASKEVVYARDLKLNTIQTMNLTVETGAHTGYNPQKWTYHKGEYDNYASVDIIDVSDGTEVLAGDGPDEGSVWVDFEVLGE